MFQLIQLILQNLTFFALHLKNLTSFPKPLSAKRETELLHKMKHQGDTDARTDLIEHNLRLVSHIIKKYYTQSADQEDLISIGTIGLIKGITTFDTSKGSRLATYAARCVENEILMHFRAQKKHSAEISLNETIDVDRDGNPLTYIDVISSDEDIAEEIDRKLLTGKMLHFIDTCLSARERQIIMMRYGLGGIKEQTQREIAASLHISRSYVSRIEKSALQKLKDALDGK